MRLSKGLVGILFRLNLEVGGGFSRPCIVCSRHARSAPQPDLPPPTARALVLASMLVWLILGSVMHVQEHSIDPTDSLLRSILVMHCDHGAGCENILRWPVMWNHVDRPGGAASIGRA